MAKCTQMAGPAAEGIKGFGKENTFEIQADVISILFNILNHNSGGREAGRKGGKNNTLISELVFLIFI